MHAILARITLFAPLAHYLHSVAYIACYSNDKAFQSEFPS